MSAHILAIDQGTSNTKALLLDARGAIVASASRPVAIHYPHPGWVEQDASDLWRTVEGAVAECLSRAPGRSIAAVAVTNQRESVVAWDRTTGQPAGPCVIWQCRRTAPFCAELRGRGLTARIEQKTGLTIDPLFSASKMRWLLDHVDRGRARAAKGELCLGTVDSWIVWNLTGGATHACDATNASRTQLYDLHAGEWDDELLDIFDVPSGVVPEIRASSGSFGQTAPGIVPGGLPIKAAIGDSHAALFGHAAFHPGVVKATYGTGSSLMSPTTAPLHSRHGLSSTVAWALGEERTFALEGNITVTGSAVDWVARLVGAPSPEAAAEMAASADDAGGVYLVPAFAGLGAPYWDDEARGLVTGLTRGTSSAHVARAAIESIAYQVRDVFDAMQADAARLMNELLADGGATRNDALMQFQADILGRPVVRHRSTDLSACGAAWLAGLAADIWESPAELEELPRATDRFEPRMRASERDARYAGWADAVARARLRPAASAERT
jgi:glycerol kinase